MIPFSQQRM